MAHPSAAPTAPRIGFLGGGFIAGYHGKMLHGSGVPHEIVAVHDPDPVKAAEFARASGARAIDREDELLDLVDAVYVCTWTSEHRRLVERIAERGLAVFCEKPLAFDLADARAMVDAVERAGVVNQVGLVLRDSPSLNLLRCLVAEESSGRVMGVMFRDDQYLPVQGQYGSTWRSDPTRSGAGTLIEHSIHDLDLLEHLFGEVAELSGRTAEFHAIQGIEDVAVTQFVFASGAIGTLTSVWHDVLARPSGRYLEVLCERAVYTLESDLFGPVRVVRGDGTGGLDDPVNGAGSFENDGLVAELVRRGISLRNPDGAFVEAVAARVDATPGLVEALRPHLLADAIYASAAGGGTWGTIPAGRP